VVGTVVIPPPVAIGIVVAQPLVVAGYATVPMPLAIGEDNTAPFDIVRLEVLIGSYVPTIRLPAQYKERVQLEGSYDTQIAIEGTNVTEVELEGSYRTRIPL
jgi:hypothetical protein